MKLAIMQPYFFPYIGYSSLIKHTDKFILFDEVQFIRHGWIERNRILKQTGGWMYIKVPIIKKEGRATLIKDILIDNEQPWREKIFAQLIHYKKKAPYYFTVHNILTRVLNNHFDFLVDLNKTSLFAVCEYLDINRNIEVFSEMSLNIQQPDAPDEWALNICNSIPNVSEYINPIGGKDIFDETKYKKTKLKLSFLEQSKSPYNQGGDVFEPALSVLDVLMFNSKSQVINMLDSIKLFPANEELI